MKRFLFPLLLLPFALGFISKNPVKTEAFDGQIQYILPDPIPDDAQSFINYWNTDFREKHPAVCDISKADYEEMYYSIYSKLSDADKTIVNATPDLKEPEYTIKQIIQTLVNKYYPSNSKMRDSKPKLDQSSIIIIATIVALVGATAISILYILKNNKVIK